jgi:hypothetical protein
MPSYWRKVNNMEKAIAIIIASVVAIAMAVFMSFVLSWPLYMLWNGCLVGAVRGVNEVTWLQAWGLSILFGLMFKTTVNTK